jgi:hypothetical protein
MRADLVQVRPLPDFVLRVELSDGRRGTFDLKPHLRQPGLKALRDPSYFAQVHVLLGAATWPDGEDIAPETLAAELISLQTA